MHWNEKNKQMHLSFIWTQTQSGGWGWSHHEHSSSCHDAGFQMDVPRKKSVPIDSQGIWRQSNAQMKGITMNLLWEICCEHHGKSAIDQTIKIDAYLFLLKTDRKGLKPRPQNPHRAKPGWVSSATIKTRITERKESMKSGVAIFWISLMPE